VFDICGGLDFALAIQVFLDPGVRSVGCVRTPLPRTVDQLGGSDLKSQTRTHRITSLAISRGGPSRRSTRASGAELCGCQRNPCLIWYAYLKGFGDVESGRLELADKVLILADI
jgi:hypothetical protein